MADLGKILNKVLPLERDDSLPDPITVGELERRILEVSYPNRRIGGRSHTHIDTALITGSIQALADFGLIRYTNPDGGPATRASSDLIHRIVGALGPAKTGFGPPPGHGTKTALIDEFGKEHMFRVGPEADAEIARIHRARRNAYIDKLRTDLAEADAAQV